MFIANKVSGNLVAWHCDPRLPPRFRTSCEVGGELEGGSELEAIVPLDLNVSKGKALECKMANMLSSGSWRR
jgi:hypothetical protein